MSKIAADKAVEVVMLLVPEKLWGMAPGRNKVVERRYKKKKQSQMNRKLTGYEERNTPPTGWNNLHRQVCVTEMAAKWLSRSIEPSRNIEPNRAGDQSSRSRKFTLQGQLQEQMWLNHFFSSCQPHTST